MRIYTAAPFMTYERVRKFNADARLAGHEVTHDWTIGDEYDAAGRPICDDGTDLPADLKARFAMEDLNGAMSADTVILLADGGPSFGSCMEAGMAIARGRKLIVVGPTAFTIFWGLSSVTVLDDEAAVRDLLGMEPMMRLAA